MPIRKVVAANSDTDFHVLNTSSFPIYCRFEAQLRGLVLHFHRLTPHLEFVPISNGSGPPLLVHLNNPLIVVRGEGDGRGRFLDEEGVVSVAGGVRLRLEEGVEIPEARLDPLFAKRRRWGESKRALGRFNGERKHRSFEGRRGGQTLPHLVRGHLLEAHARQYLSELSPDLQ